MPDFQGHLGSPPPYSAIDGDEKVDNHSPAEDSVCYLFIRSLMRYETLLLALQAESLRSTRISIMLVPEVKDDLSRLRVWGEQTYAVFPQDVRDSLDEQLREDEDTRRIVMRSLRRLNSYIAKAIEQTERHSSTDELDTEGAEYLSSSDESDTQQEGLQTVWEIRLHKIVDSIFENVRSLYRVSGLLRRPQNSSYHITRGVEFLQLVDYHRQQDVRQQFLPLHIAGPKTIFQASLEHRGEQQEADNEAKNGRQVRIDIAKRESLESIGWLPKDIDREHNEVSSGSGHDMGISLSVDRPLLRFPQINRKHLDIETLEHYTIPWGLDNENRNYMIILMELEEYEMDVLFEHTRRRRRQQRRRE